MDKQQQVAQTKFAQLGFFILPLPKGSEFGFDGRLFAVDSFSGVKFLPPGLHFFVFSAAPSASQTAHLPEAVSSGVGVRHGILRYYKQGDVVVEEWDNAREELKRPAGETSRKRRRTLDAAGKGDAKQETVVSDEYLKSLDKSLAPYPQEEIAEQWAGLTGFITEKTVVRVVGVDAQGCALVDALMGSTMDDQASGPDGSSGRRTWGKVREDEPEVRELVEEDEEAAGPALLEFVKYDEKRSWPKGATGEELSKWSKDKSWQLSEVVQNQLKDDPKELLAEFQLAFILFSLLHNFSSLTAYRSLFSLICRSTSLAHPLSTRPTSTPLPSPTLSSASLPIFASFLSALTAQIDFLESTFFSTQLPALESHLLDSLTVLSQALSDALPAWVALGEKDPAIAGVWKEVVKRWDGLAALSMEKYGWDLGVIKGSRAQYTAPQGRSQREEDEIDLEDLEEGEDAPVIIDDEGLYISSATDDY
ncbi:hypothetical protein JCM10207_006446 [Rhodosporidiobolus poonsookiae]